MADGNNHAPIIIKKKKHGEHGHHGGAWKVAYADFVTAMMAFFLLLWLLNVTTDEQKRGISQYFTPESVSRSTSGSGGVLGGISLSPGSMPRSTASTLIAVATPVPTNPTQAEEADDEATEEAAGAMERARDPSDRPERPRDISDRDNLAGNGPDANPDAGRGPDPNDQAGKGKAETPKEAATEKELAKAVEQREEQAFKKVEEELRAKLQQNAELRALAQNLMIDRTDEGLRIQLVDQAKTSMFPLGSAMPYDYAKKLLGMVTQAVQGMPNQVAVTGHTDANQFARTNAYSNWELSTDRAHSSRRAMLEFGLPAERVARVVGKADREPLFANEPNDPRNRRISIVLLHEKPNKATP